MLKKLVGWFFRKKALKPVIITRDQHSISRSNISNNALKVLYRLHKKGYQAYLVGGVLRDLLLERAPKDFDIVTNATPWEIERMFVNCRLIGRRFRLAHISFGGEIIEVATFRATSKANNTIQSDKGMILSDNVYGTIVEDVMRRDFTANALYYNIADFSIVDYVGGLKDIANRQIVVIGDPMLRYREDPVRMLRAIRFAAKLQFSIEKSSMQAIKQLGKLLEHVPKARLFEEYLKLFYHGSSYDTFELLKNYGLLKFLFPQLDAIFRQNSEKFQNGSLIAVCEALGGAQKLKEDAYNFVKAALINTDSRIAESKTTLPAFLIAALLWYPILFKQQKHIAKGLKYFPSFYQAVDDVMQGQLSAIAIPKRIMYSVKEIWELQLRLAKNHGRRAGQLFRLHRFRAAFDFLLLRAENKESEDVVALAKWWQRYMHVSPEEQWQMAKAAGKNKKTKKSKNKNKGKELGPDEGRKLEPDEGRKLELDEGRKLEPDEGRKLGPDEGRKLEPDEDGKR